MKQNLGFSLGACLLVASAAPSFANTPVITLYEDGVWMADWIPDANDYTWDAAEERWHVMGLEYTAGSTIVDVNELAYDVDPIVYHNILVHNGSGATKSYNLTVTLGVAAQVPATLMRGSIDTSVIGTDALVSAPGGGSIYSALIDGSSVRTLQAAPFALGTGQSATSDFVEFFDEIGPAVATEIGIQLTFELSPDDDAAILSDFAVVEVIPEPGTAALLVLGAGVLLWRRQLR